MSLSKVVEAMKQEAKKQRQQEREIVQELAAITSVEFAKQAAEELSSRRHPYSFGAYLVLLRRLQELVSAGIPNCMALDAVQTCETAETIINAWRLANAGDK